MSTAPTCVSRPQGSALNSFGMAPVPRVAFDPLADFVALAEADPVNVIDLSRGTTSMFFDPFKLTAGAR